MKPKFVQLPPLPLDLPVESIEAIWSYVRMAEEDRIMIQEFMKENVNGNVKNLGKTAFVKMMQDDSIEITPDVEEYIELMRKLIGTLMAQACEIAALVYGHYRMEGKSIEKISDEFHLGQELLELMAQYYDENIDSLLL